MVCAEKDVLGEMTEGCKKDGKREGIIMSSFFLVYVFYWINFFLISSSISTVHQMPSPISIDLPPHLPHRPPKSQILAPRSLINSRKFLMGGS